MNRYFLFFILSMMSGCWSVNAMEQKKEVPQFDDAYYRDQNSLIEAWALGTLKFCCIDNGENGDFVAIEYSDYEDTNKLYRKGLLDTLGELSNYYVCYGALLGIKSFCKDLQEGKKVEEKIAWLQKAGEVQKYQLQILRLFDCSDIWYLAKMINEDEELKTKFVKNVSESKKTCEMKQLVDEDIKKTLNIKNWPLNIPIKKLIPELIMHLQEGKVHPFFDMNVRQQIASKRFRCSIL